jgi:hypothetical protein
MTADEFIKLPPIDDSFPTRCALVALFQTRARVLTTLAYLTWYVLFRHYRQLRFTRKLCSPTKCGGSFDLLASKQSFGWRLGQLTIPK